MAAPVPRKRWRVRIGETVYGPYSTEHMMRFIKEGRIVAWSVVKPIFGGKWRHAGEDPILSRYLFPGAFDDAPAPRAKPIIKTDFEPPAARIDCRRMRPANDSTPAPRDALAVPSPVESALVTALRDMLREPVADAEDPAIPPDTVERAVREQPPMTRLCVTIALGDDPSAQTLFDDAIRMLGEAAMIDRGVWLLAARHTAGTVRNHLHRYASQTQRIFVIDTLSSRSAWYNLTPDCDRHVRLILDGPLC